MANEMTDANAAWSYSLDPTNACVVRRKRNKPGARWEARPYRIYANEHDAKAALLRLARLAERDA